MQLLFSYFNTVTFFRYHKDCLAIPDVVFDRTKKVYWECNGCWKSGVVRWGGNVDGEKRGPATKIINSCPIDSILTAIHIFEKAHSNFIGCLPRSRPGTALKICLNLCRKRKYTNGKLAWIQFLETHDPKLFRAITKTDKLITYNVFGGIGDLFLQFFTSYWLREFIIACPNSRQCKQKARFNRASRFTLKPEDV